MQVHGRCLIPCDNVKLYGKVTKRLRKDKIPFEESFLEEATWGQLTNTNVECHNDYGKHDYGKPKPPRRTSGPAIVITYRKEAK
jgi:hypothetical protein